MLWGGLISVSAVPGFWLGWDEGAEPPCRARPGQGSLLRFTIQSPDPSIPHPIPPSLEAAEFIAVSQATEQKCHGET